MVLAACAAPAPTPTPVPTQPPAEPTKAPEQQAQPTEVPPTATPEPTPTSRPPRTGGWLDAITMVKISPDAVLTQLQAEEIDIYASTLGRAEQFKAAQDARLGYTQNFGGAYELTFNPYGGGANGALFDQSTGKLNPFAVPAIREAMNMLVDRDYIVQEIYGGLASPKFFPITGAFPDYARLADVARELEAKYAYNETKADEIITAEMEKLGATKVDGKWTYNGEPVTLIFIIRNDGDGTRKLIGDYVSAQLEKIGFTVDRQYKTSSEASPIWIRGNPADGLWHLYTGGWLTTAVDRDQGDNFLSYYTKDGQPLPLWQAYKPTEEFYQLAQALNNNNFSTLEERRELFAKALRLAMEDSVRVWLVDQKAFSPYRPDVSVTGDLAGGIQGSQLQAFTLRFADREGGDLKYAMSDLLVEPWNPVAGSNWVFDTAPKRFINDYGLIADPFTGLAWPQRVESASVEVKEGLPVGKTLDWVDFKFAAEIKVPADAFIDWDAEKQVFITVGEKFPEGLTANRKSTVTYPKDFFQKTKWHDGSNFSVGDFMMLWIMTFDRAKEASKIYDKSAVASFETFAKDFKGFRIVSTDPFVVEYYSDAFALDAELNVFDNWPEYGYGNGAWHMIAIGNLAEENGELAYSAAKADEKKIEWMSFIDGPSLEILKKYLDQAAAEKYVPYAPTLSQYITLEEAAARYQNLADWYAKQGHFWIGTGPYYLDKVFSVEKTLTLKHNPDFQDPADKWARFAEAKIAQVEVDGEGRVTIGKEASFDVLVTFKDQPYPAAEIQEVKYLLFDANNALVATGVAEATGDGQYAVKLDADVTGKLTEGSNKLEVVVTSKLVSVPTFASFQFVTVK
ncbi:MAG: ABC transporter substrate-binding protein [Thermoflexales bacterium]|nr:ABC transporter substrate-binding protein [Thermoflexales bacterium]